MDFSDIQYNNNWLYSKQLSNKFKCNYNNCALILNTFHYLEVNCYVEVLFFYFTLTIPAGGPSYPEPPSVWRDWPSLLFQGPGWWWTNELLRRTVPCVHWSSESHCLSFQSPEEWCSLPVTHKQNTVQLLISPLLTDINVKC